MEINEPQRPTAVYQVVLIVFLGGGNSNIFGIFTPKLGEDDFHFDLRIFFRWVASTTNQRSRAKGGGATSSFFHPKRFCHDTLPETNIAGAMLVSGRVNI